MPRWYLLVTVFLAPLSSGFAADMSKVDRTINREPTYIVGGAGATHVFDARRK